MSRCLCVCVCLVHLCRTLAFDLICDAEQSATEDQNCIKHTLLFVTGFIRPQTATVPKGRTQSYTSTLTFVSRSLYFDDVSSSKCTCNRLYAKTVSSSPTEARRQRPNKPITHADNSHSHVCCAAIYAWLFACVFAFVCVCVCVFQHA